MREVEKVVPVGKKVLVEVIYEEPKPRVAGIILSLDEAYDDTPKPTDRCKVISCGNDVDKVEVNRTYMFNQYAGITVTFEGEKYLLLDEHDFYIKLT